MTAPHERFVPYTGTWKMVLPSEWPGDRATAALRSLLAGILSGLRDAGSPMIGHIKVLASAGAAGHVAMSVTRYDEIPQAKGGFHGNLGALELTIAVIVMDTRHEDLARIVERSLSGELNPELAGDTTGESK